MTVEGSNATAVGSYPSYRAPSRDGEIVCLPSWQSLPQQLTTARQKLTTTNIQISGIPLAELANSARSELISQAIAHTNRYADASVSATENSPLIITGHQPELFHPGVWLKNFAAAKLAHQVNGTAISLIIDNDLCRTPSIRVPTGTIEKPQVLEELFDQPQAKLPYEQRKIVDFDLWKSFGQRVTATLAPLVAEPLISTWWPNVIEASRDTPHLGLAIAQARHSLERSWGHPSLEIPQSTVCQTDAFRYFMLHLLSEAQQLRLDYNDALANYRQAHHLRNSAQPLPNLAEIEGWTETPFWIWTQTDPTRRALYAQKTSHELRLTDRQQWQASLPLSSPASALQQLADWQSQGIKLRTRALITTLFARLLLADTFIHGIGGAKYDQVTDDLCRRFLGVAPPSFTTMSGTLRLPIPHPTVSPEHQNKLKQTLRELRYHPEAHLQDHQDKPEIKTLIDTKKKWIETDKTENNAAERHAGITHANESLQPWLAAQRNNTEIQLQSAANHIRANRVLESREYAFCLFPRELLHDFFLDFSS